MAEIAGFAARELARLAADVARLEHENELWRIRCQTFCNLKIAANERASRLERENERLRSRLARVLAFNQIKVACHRGRVWSRRVPGGRRNER